MTNICNFCLKISNACSYVDETLKETIELIFTNVELLIAEFSKICKQCIRRVHLAFDVKADIICNEDFVVSYETNKPRHEKLIDVYLQKNKIKCDGFLNELKICRFCITVISENNFYLLEDVEVIIGVREIITHLPEVDFSITSNPLVCHTCLKKLQDYEMFINSWLDIYNLKKKYLLCNNKTDISDLNEVRKFIFDTRIGPQHSAKYDMYGTNEFYNVDCVVDNIQPKDNIEVHDELNYSTEGDPIKIEPVCSDVEIGNDILTENDNFVMDELKVKTEIFQSETKMELDDYNLKEEEITIYDVQDYDCTEFGDYAGRDSDGSSLCNNIQGTRYQKSNECFFLELEEPIEISKNSKLVSSYFRNVSPKMEQERLRLAKKSIEQTMKSGNSANRAIEVNDGFRCGLCPFQNQLEAQVKEHCENYHDYKYSHLILDNLVDEKNSVKLEKYLIVHPDEINFYKCEHCIYKTKYKHVLERHLISHSDEYILYKRGRCGYKSKRKRNLKRNLITYSDETFKCEQCDFPSKNKSSLKQHLPVHSIEMYKYEHYDYKCKRERYLKYNLAVHSNQTYKCYHCDYIAKQKCNLIRHLITHSDETYKCDHCDYKSTNKRYLKQHLAMHSNETYKCDHCDFQSKHKSSLKQHLPTHSNETYKCDHCDFQSKRKSSLKQHLQMHSNETYKCEHCDYTCKRKRYLKYHLTMHFNEPYKCAHCDFQSQRKNSLKEHLAMHSNETYKCDHCDYKSKRKSYLKYHLAIHSNGTYKCDHCDYKFKTKNYLQQHLAMLSNVTYKCEHCDYTCKRKRYLKYHLATHFKETYKCAHCDFQSKHKSSLKQHLPMHSNKTYKCEHCDYKCKHERYLKYHLATHSNETYKMLPL